MAMTKFYHKLARLSNELEKRVGYNYKYRYNFDNFNR